MKRLYSPHAIVIYCLLFFFFFASRGITLPYVGYHAFNFNIYSLIAHNYNHFGLLETKLAPITSATAQLPPNPSYYLHHPPLISLSEALVFGLFGEYFWTGRLTIILFAVGTLLLLYAVGMHLRGPRFGIMVLAVAVLMPATPIFSRMIGQEPLILFFVMLTILSILCYTKRHQTRYLLLTWGAVALGTFSDWPMAYFVISLLPFLVYKKLYKLAVGMIVVVGAIVAGWLLYVNWLGGLDDLKHALLVRSIGDLVTLPYWQLRWVGTIGIRFLVYFNPLITAASVFFIIKLIRGKKETSERLLFFGLLSFGAMHLAFYPSGAFGHPYWIYYLIPFMSFAGADAAMTIVRKPAVLVILVLCSLIFLLGVEQWKTGEIQGNVWRYDLAKQANNTLAPYELVAVNHDSAMDLDVFHYTFLHDIKVETPNAAKNSTFRHYIFTCNTTCDLKDPRLKTLLHYKANPLLSSQGQGYVIDLRDPAASPTATQEKSLRQKTTIQKYTQTHTNVARQILNSILDLLKAPQI